MSRTDRAATRRATGPLWDEGPGARIVVNSTGLVAPVAASTQAKSLQRHRRSIRPRAAKLTFARWTWQPLREANASLLRSRSISVASQLSLTRRIGPATPPFVCTTDVRQRSAIGVGGERFRWRGLRYLGRLRSSMRGRQRWLSAVAAIRARRSRRTQVPVQVTRVAGRDRAREPVALPLAGAVEPSS